MWKKSKSRREKLENAQSRRENIEKHDIATRNKRNTQNRNEKKREHVKSRWGKNEKREIATRKTRETWHRDKQNEKNVTSRREKREKRETATRKSRKTLKSTYESTWESRLYFSRGARRTLHSQTRLARLESWKPAAPDAAMPWLKGAWTYRNLYKLIWFI